MTCVPQDHARSTVRGTGCPRQFHERSTAHSRPQPCLPARSWPVPRPVHTRAPWPWQAPHPRMIRRQAPESGAFSLPVPREFHDNSTPQSAPRPAVPRQFHAPREPVPRQLHDAPILALRPSSTTIPRPWVPVPRQMRTTSTRVPRLWAPVPRHIHGCAPSAESAFHENSTPVPRHASAGGRVCLWHPAEFHESSTAPRGPLPREFHGPTRATSTRLPCQFHGPTRQFHESSTALVYTPGVPRVDDGPRRLSRPLRRGMRSGRRRR